MDGLIARLSLESVRGHIPRIPGPRPATSESERRGSGGEGRGRSSGGLRPMNDVTRILSAIEQGDPQAAEQLLPLVYDELRKLAAQRLAQEKPGQTLQATALVHEAYLRLVGADEAHGWDSRGHFFAAAAEAMRRILVENARRKRAAKHGGGRRAGRASRALDVVAEAPARATCSPSTRPWPGSPPRTPARPSWSSSASSPG